MAKRQWKFFNSLDNARPHAFEHTWHPDQDMWSNVTDVIHESSRITKNVTCSTTANCTEVNYTLKEVGQRQPAKQDGTFLNIIKCAQNRLHCLQNLSMGKYDRFR